LGFTGIVTGLEQLIGAKHSLLRLAPAAVPRDAVDDRQFQATVEGPHIARM
jgi:hypothetical protein